MPNFTAGTSFTDGVTNDVTALKLNALVADAVPTSSLALASTTGTISNFTSSTATITGAITGSTNVINIGSGQIYKDASGNVGIGTTSPASKLHVVGTGGSLRMQDSIANAKYIQLRSDVTNSHLEHIGGPSDALRINNQAAGQIEFLTNNTERLRIDASGNVGIGTGAKIGFGGTNTFTSHYIKYDSTLNGLQIDSFGATAFNTNNTERFRIDSSGNVIISGNKSLVSNGAGGVASNTSIGSSALASNTTGSNNTASGLQALVSNTTGLNNTASGYQALYSNTTGYNNTASGYQALYSNTTGYQNTASGVQTLVSNTTGVSNTASGLQALYFNTTGYNNTASGYAALYFNTTGTNNTASGFQALINNTTGYQNTADGVNALANNTTGYQNTANGVTALNYNTTGANNTASGYNAGYGASGTNANTTGSNNTFIGNESVGASATANNVITLGNGSIATLRCQVTSITALSDKRDKKDIENLSAGLDFVGKLRPVSFVWNTRDKAKVNIPDAGFIAQELLDVQETTGITIPNLVSQENPEKLEAAYGTLIPVLVQAIKELKAKVELLEEKNK